MHRSKQPHYSITSSARAGDVADSSSPRALAVSRLIVSWYFVGCGNGRSPVDNAEVRGARYQIRDSGLAGFGLRAEASGAKTFKNS